ncbi:MAG TPA: hypothetical protein V6C84_12490 [Coleofasciculaceae cyanobacterium]|jgi:hypothetical protein
MNSSSPDPVLPIVIVSLEGGKLEGEGRDDRFRVKINATKAIVIKGFSHYTLP